MNIETILNPSTRILYLIKDCICLLKKFRIVNNPITRKGAKNIKEI